MFSLFSKQFCVVAIPFEPSSPTRPPEFPQNIIQHFTAPSIQKEKIHRSVSSLSFVSLSLSSVLICGRSSFAAFTEWKNCNKILFGALQIHNRLSPPRLHKHFADILNSQLIHTVTLLLQRSQRVRIVTSYPDNLISESMVSSADSPFKFPLLPPSRFLDLLVLAFSIVKLLHQVRPKLDLSEWRGGTESFVGIACQNTEQHSRRLWVFAGRFVNASCLLK